MLFSEQGLNAVFAPDPVFARVERGWPVAIGLSLVYVAYYLVASVYLTMVSPRARARRPAGPGDLERAE